MWSWIAEYTCTGWKSTFFMKFSQNYLKIWRMQNPLGQCKREGTPMDIQNAESREMPSTNIVYQIVPCVALVLPLCHPWFGPVPHLRKTRRGNGEVFWESRTDLLYGPTPAESFWDEKQKKNSHEDGLSDLHMWSIYMLRAKNFPCFGHVKSWSPQDNVSHRNKLN